MTVRNVCKGSESQRKSRPYAGGGCVSHADDVTVAVIVMKEVRVERSEVCALSHMFRRFVERCGEMVRQRRKAVYTIC